jgi:hypothetical protein
LRSTPKLGLVFLAGVLLASGAAPLSAQSQTSPAEVTPPATSNPIVWVNTDSGVYHQPGSRRYGKTKHGKYMPEADAIKAGYHASGKH